MTAVRAPVGGRDVIPLGQATRAWFAISLQTFGGPAGQIAVMQHHLVDRHRWLSERRFLHALNYCMLLPGPEAQQLAIYTGWLLNGVRGGRIAGVLFVLPELAALLVTFGGAYAVLAYVAQQAVNAFGWLAPGEMVRGLALAESTPGPLIMVVQFVAFLGAFRNPEALNPWVAGVLASLLTVWVTFVPCFLFIFLGAPYVERLRGNRHLTAALNGITAAVVGVIASLAAYFALHTLFAGTRLVGLGPARVELPVWSSVDPVAVVITALALGMIFWRRWSPLRTLGVCAALGPVVGLVSLLR